MSVDFSKTCQLDFEKNLITDTKSTNGTVFNNGIKRKKDKENISDLKSFCLADVFKFEVSRFMNSISFKLVEIMNKQYENKPENKDYLTSLKNTSFVYLAENDTMTLNKKNAKLNESDKIQEEIIEIKRINNAFYVSDFAKGLKEIHPEHIFSERFTFKAD
ncbi:MAG: hypothetical protein CSB55_00995 [Candidatus Cloacimonadota bacterium]|nr:MAG: hypothetical protein CSB55_00995 [Candidatus Cloacimonadota bacterium]